MTKPIYWDEAVIYLSQKDRKLKNVIAKYDDNFLLKSIDPFTTLLRAVLGQQISVKVAESTWKKLNLVYNDINPITILEISDGIFREIGLSRQKINYFRNIANYFFENNFNPHNFTSEELLIELMKIKGIGRWTAEMFMIFHMNSPDILPLGDVGLIKAIEIIYNEKNKMNKEDIIKLAELWKPYSTVATWYLWRSLDPFVINY